MLKKIISGGQTGADQAALDVAINMGIPHGGWIPKGRKTEKGVLPAKYLLQEMPDGNYANRTEKNVIDSDGTLILSHGKLSGGSELTRVFAEKLKRPCLHLDLKIRSAFQAAQMIKNWIVKHNIEVLNVAGPRESNDPNIYQVTVDILNTALYMDIIDESMPDLFSPPNRSDFRVTADRLPGTVAQAVDILISSLTFKEKSKLASLPASRLTDLRTTLGKKIQFEFKLDERNNELLESCRIISNNDSLTSGEAVFVVLKALWKKLQHKTNLLKLVSPPSSKDGASR